LVETILQLLRRGKEQVAKPSTALVIELARVYRTTPPGEFRDELARMLCRVAPERYRELSRNPAGVCACLADLVYLDGALVFFLDLSTGGNKVFEQPTLVLERPGTLGLVAETKRVPLPVLNLEGSWEKGFAGEALLAVRIDLGKVITIPQRNPNV